jgi:hypothetical protein
MVLDVGWHIGSFAAEAFPFALDPSTSLPPAVDAHHHLLGTHKERTQYLHLCG